MNLSIGLFIIGILGFVLNRKNIILMLISIEIMLLSVTLLILVSSYAFDDILGQTYSIYIIAIAGAESAIGLGILVAYYRLRGTIALNLYLSLLLLPLFGSVIGGLMGRKIGTTGVQLITTSLVGISAVLTCIAFYEVAINGHAVTINLGNWIDSEIMDITWAFSFDSLTVSMLLPVLVVSTFVHVFSIDYMAGDPHAQRFFAYLSMFTFCMLVLVTGDNYLIMFLGWEGIGISSYLLINFWFTRIQANKSAIKALVVNRVGDMFLSVGFFAVLFLIGNIDYSTAFTIAPFLNTDAVTIVGLLFLLAAMGKSAQLGLHQWLPDAMEGNI